MAYTAGSSVYFCSLHCLLTLALQKFVKKAGFPGATIAPVIVATDKTQLTQFSGGKSAYPVYLTIGNIPKALRRKPTMNVCILIAYLSIDKVDKTNMTQNKSPSQLQCVFHQSMKTILSPLINAGKEGIYCTGSDGAICHVFPFLSCYVTDYPEQCLVTCSKYTTCVKCKAKHDALGNPKPGEDCTQKWTQNIIDDAKKAAKGKTSKFHQFCMSYNIASGVYEPFWKDFPLCNINEAMTPDILHQLYQGVLKHLIHWCQRMLGPLELDHQIWAMSLASGVHHFKNGFSALSQITGLERKNMAKIHLGCLVGVLPLEGIQAVTALLDFIYLSQYTAHDSITIWYLEDALARFHEHKEFFKTASVRDNFNIPKFHSMLHYVEAICLFGTTDKYNTKMFEHLHIDFAKEG